MGKKTELPLLPKAFRKIQVIDDTRPRLGEALRYLYFYATAEDPERILCQKAIPPAGEYAVVSIHNHTSASKSEGGSDGLDSFEELLDSAGKSGINILGVTDHLSAVELNSGRLLENYYGQGLGFRAYEKWQALRKAGEAPKDLSILPGVELEIRTRGDDISGRHLLVLNATYDDFERAFQSGDPSFSFSSEDEKTKTEEIYRHAGKIGLERAARELSSIETVLVIDPHPSVLFAGGPTGRKSGHSWEELNIDANLALMVGEEFRKEVGFDRAYPAALMMGAIPPIESKREGETGRTFFSSDSHIASLASFALTYASGIDPKKYFGLEDPRNEIVRDLKNAISERRLSGGVSPEFIDVETGRANGYGRGLLEEYFRKGKAVAYQTLSPQALGAAKMLSTFVLGPAREAGRRLSERGYQDALERIGHSFGISPEIYGICRKIPATR